MSATELQRVDLSEYTFAPSCDHNCGHPATVVAQGCGDEHPVLLCDQCLHRGLEVIANYVRLWQKTNKQIFICGHCHRPMLSLDTHLEVRRLPNGGEAT